MRKDREEQIIIQDLLRVNLVHLRQSKNNWILRRIQVIKMSKYALILTNCKSLKSQNSL